MSPTNASDGDASAARQRASDYIRTRYVLPLGLSGTADNVIEATHIAAGYELTTPGFWSKTFTPAQQKTLTGVDAIRWTVSENAAMEKGYNAQLPVSPAIDALFGGTSNSGLYLGVIG
ncbi:MAG: hypothetical protein ABJN39_09350 [Sulfitobacter sp.]|uniref:hypothetical protein n=1 Tax=Alphaproteobacteria TaxID=28211 RepID=UPI002941BDA8|nr:hypothetical protein [Sulfitobacter sp. LC.270.F.C4]WOI13580.1 hypothetical protein R1T45_01750 [Sulfitobacter sp. LC.270.F.C4]